MPRFTCTPLHKLSRHARGQYRPRRQSYPRSLWQITVGKQGKTAYRHKNFSGGVMRRRRRPRQMLDPLPPSALRHRLSDRLPDHRTSDVLPSTALLVCARWHGWLVWLDKGRLGRCLAVWLSALAYVWRSPR
jgi:hypothetical protein